MRSAPIPDDKLAVLLLSGGLDSMVSGGLAREEGCRLIALTIDYNQRHRIELDAARRVAAALNVERHIVLPLNLALFGGSALTDDIAVPKTGVEGGIPATYVPGRNIVFLSLTLSLAEASGAGRIYIGVNSLDYSGYPDCRPDFVAAFETMAALGTKAGVEGHGVRIKAPLQYLTKADIAKEAARLGLDAGMSWSCYDPTPDGRHCGLCDSCRLRARGFEEAGLPDPTRYAARLTMTYTVKEMFLTLQGEGMQAGRRAVFLRFAGCNLWSGREQDRATAVCRFCDTDFVGTDGENGGKFADAAALAEAVAQQWGADRKRRFLVITGGEPMLQLDTALLDALHGGGFEIAVESNGTLPATPGIDWLCISPKAGSEVVQRTGDELKLVWPQQGVDPADLLGWDFGTFLVQPMDCGNERDNQATREAAIALVMSDPRWRLTLQTHKLLGLK